MRNCICIFITLIFCLVTISCQTPQSTTPAVPAQEEPQAPQAGQPSTTPAAPQVPSKGAVDCSVVATTEQLSTGIKQLLPANLYAIAESHYISVEDGWKGPASSGTDQIQKHLDLSCALLKKSYGVTDCSKVYGPSYAKVWNGTDGAGPIGLGGFINVTSPVSLKNLRPSLEAELFQMNMYWVMTKGANGEILSPYAPAYPTKYIVTYKDKHVVVSAGYEQGPPLKDGRIGTSVETFYFLGAPNSRNVTQFAVGRLKDQSIPYGPVNCK